jgi:hypothetical protein
LRKALGNLDAKPIITEKNIANAGNEDSCSRIRLHLTTSKARQPGRNQDECPIATISGSNRLDFLGLKEKPMAGLALIAQIPARVIIHCYCQVDSASKRQVQDIRPTSRLKAHPIALPDLPGPDMHAFHAASIRIGIPCRHAITPRFIW